MEIFRGVQALSRALRHPVVTIGNFDGVHLGHLEIIRQAREQARSRKGECVAFTFRPHPQRALNPDRSLQLLCTYEEKLDLLAQAGVDVVIEEPFSREFSTVAPDVFFSDVILRRLCSEAIVVGYDFGFGKGRQGSLDVLSRLCEQGGIGLTVVSPHKVGAEVVSSSRIRQHLANGEIEAANRLLGREFFYRGVVVRGEGRGRQIGFPTANLKLENKLALPYGVYAGWAWVEGKRYPAVTNIGVRPTFQTDDEKEFPAVIEVHLIDETIDLYGRTLEVRFLRRLRSEKKFSGIDQLKAQIASDVESTKEILVKMMTA